jgi:hypothetical protein
MFVHLKLSHKISLNMAPTAFLVRYGNRKIACAIGNVTGYLVNI